MEYIVLFPAKKILFMWIFVMTTKRPFLINFFNLVVKSKKNIKNGYFGVINSSWPEIIPYEVLILGCGLWLLRRAKTYYSYLLVLLILKIYQPSLFFPSPRTLSMIVVVSWLGLVGGTNPAPRPPIGTHLPRRQRQLIFYFLIWMCT